MKKKYWLLFLIFILALLLRVAFIGRFPATLYGDEQAFAWNAYNILKTGSDEYGVKMPLEFRSFEDYKAPIGVYLLVPFIKVLGLNAFAVRLPVSFFGALTVLPTFLLGRLFASKKNALIASFLLAISPWHVHLSRGFFEAVLALFFYLFALYFLIKTLKSSVNNWFWSLLFFALALYTYFTPRILIPLVLLFLFVFYKAKRNLPIYAKYFIMLVLLSLPLIFSALSGPGLSRMNKLSGSLSERITETVNSERRSSQLSENLKLWLHNKFTVRARFLKDNIFEQLSLNYWYLYGDSSLRYSLGKMGMFYLLELPFFLSGFLFLYKSDSRNFFLMTALIVLAVIPAGLVDRPFAVRSLGMLPFPFYFVAVGLNRVTKLFSGNKDIFLKLLLPMGFAFSLFIVLTRYYFEYPVYAATWWGYENKKALDYAKERENGYRQIFISDYYTGAPLAYAVYNSLDPMEYRQALENPVTVVDGRKMIKFGNYYFGSLDLNLERLRNKVIPENSLYLGRPEEPPGEAEISAPGDGRLLFTIQDTLKKECYLKKLKQC